MDPVLRIRRVGHAGPLPHVAVVLRQLFFVDVFLEEGEELVNILGLTTPCKVVMVGPKVSTSVGSYRGLFELSPSGETRAFC